MTTRTLGELAELLQGECLGNPGLAITQVVHPLQANSPSDLALVLDKAVLPLLAQKPIQTALVPADLTVDAIPNQIKVARPKVALAQLLDVFEKPVFVAPGIHPSAVVDPTATLGEGVAIGPLCWVGPNTVIGQGTRLVANVSVGAEVQIGENGLFHPGACVGDRVQIGHRVILQPNASVGNDGYSYVTPEKGSVESARATGRIEAQNTAIIRINSIGTVVLEDDVEIGANACIDRATLGETRIKRGSKIDNLVQVAHNVTIGENCLIVSQVGIAGSTTIGDRTVLAGQVGVKDHTRVGSDCVIMAQSGVSKDVEDKSILIGGPAVPYRQFLQTEMQLKRLKSLYQKVDELTRKLDALETQTQQTEQLV